MPSFNRTAAALGLAASAIALAAPAQAQVKFLGEVFMVGFDWCPRNSLQANGSILSIAQNQALFSLLGTTYGGNGQTTFALPDLRGRSPIHTGQGPGLSSVVQGQVFGTESTTLTTSNLPAHNHSPQMRIARTNATSTDPDGTYIARAADNVYAPNAPTGDLMAAGAIQESSVGSGTAVNNMMPSLVMNYCVVTAGIFPSRN